MILTVQEEKQAWEKWNSQNHTPQLSPEQILTWLDGFRELMFEVWEKNPELLEQYKKINGFSIQNQIS